MITGVDDEKSVCNRKLLIYLKTSRPESDVGSRKWSRVHKLRDSHWYCSSLRVDIRRLDLANMAR